jgi:signal transduction histidine kinase
MEASTQTTLLILGASVFLFVITLFVAIILMAFKRRYLVHQLEKARLQEEASISLLKAQIEMQEQTFQQISKDLHDNVGQLLSSCRMLIGLTERNLQPDVPDALITANATLSDAINELRNLSKSLDPEWIGQFSFHNNLLQIIDRLNAGKAVTARYESNAQILLSSQSQIMLFRVVQEAIQNALRHAQATRIAVETNMQENMLHIKVSNNGKGFEVTGSRQGMGISNMMHRTKLLGGTIDWKNETNDMVTTVYISVPANPPT